MARNQTDMETRLGELEATVRGLTQELVEANERIRQLEAAVDGDLSADGGEGPSTEPSAGADPTRNGANGSQSSDDSEATKQMGGGGEPDDKADSELDDIIVA